MLSSKEVYDKFIQGRPLYRVVSEEFKDKILEEGIRFGNDPYKGVHAMLEGFFNLLLDLHRKGTILTLQWGKPVDQLKFVQVSRIDISEKYIDFNVNEDTVDYYQKMRGGALAHNIFNLCNQLKVQQDSLSKKSRVLIQKVLHWSEERKQFGSWVLVVRGHESCLQNGLLKPFGSKAALPSPFGSFEHFEAVVAKRGLDTLLPILRGDCLSHLRVLQDIPASCIEVL